MERIRQRRRIGVLSVCAARVVVLAMAVLPFVGNDSMALYGLIAAQVLICGFNAVGACAVNSWLHQLISHERLGDFFARRLFSGTALACVGTLAAGAMASAITLYLWGRLSDRMSNKGVLALVLPVYFACVLALVFVDATRDVQMQLAILYTIHAVMGLATGGIALATGNLGLELAPSGEGTVYLAAIGLASAIAFAVLPDRVRQLQRGSGHAACGLDRVQVDALRGSSFRDHGPHCQAPQRPPGRGSGAQLNARGPRPPRRSGTPPPSSGE